MSNTPAFPVSETVLLGYISPTASSKQKTVIDCPEWSSIPSFYTSQLEELASSVEILPNIPPEVAQERFALSDSFVPLQAAMDSNSVVIEIGVTSNPGTFLYHCAQRMRDGSYTYVYFLQRNTSDGQELFAIDPTTYSVQQIKNAGVFYNYRNRCFDTPEI